MVKSLYLEYIFKRSRNKEGENEKEEKKEGRREEEREKREQEKEIVQIHKKKTIQRKLEQAFQNVNIQVINEDKNVLENKNMFLMHFKTKGL